MDLHVHEQVKHDFWFDLSYQNITPNCFYAINCFDQCRIDGTTYNSGIKTRKQGAWLRYANEKSWFFNKTAARNERVIFHSNRITTCDVYSMLSAGSAARLATVTTESTLNSIRPIINIRRTYPRIVNCFTLLDTPRDGLLNIFNNRTDGNTACWNKANTKGILKLFLISNIPPLDQSRCWELLPLTVVRA